MGRRSRRRHVEEPAAERPPASGIARVHVDDATWSEFRRAIEDRSVAEVLGRYVELEVARAQREQLSGANLSQRELTDALDAARLLTESLQCITQRLEARLPRHF